VDQTPSSGVHVDKEVLTGFTGGVGLHAGESGKRVQFTEELEEVSTLLTLFEYRKYPPIKIAITETTIIVMIIICLLVTIYFSSREK
jgi:hypothetical protein